MGIVAAYAVPHPPLAMPEVGRGQERAIQDTLDAYREVARRIAAHAPETIVVVSPHAPLFRDCFHLSTGDFDRGDMGRFGAWDSSMTVQYDGEMTAAIAACARKHTVPLCGSGMGGKDLDHATIVPLHFVNDVPGGAHRAVGPLAPDAPRAGALHRRGGRRSGSQLRPHRQRRLVP